MQQTPVLIVGGGIVGLATAWQWSLRHPNLPLILLEKEAQVAQHQTGHNSGVLHSGIYYRPGSLKAENCRNGKRLMEQFCQEEEIAFERCGKVIVATNSTELEALKMILERGRQNGIECEQIDQHRLRELEPYVDGICAIHVPEAGIVDYGQVCRRLAEKVTSRGNQILCNTEVLSLEQTGEEVVLQTSRGEFRGQYLINCAGLQSDKVVAKSGQQPEVQIVPFRGEYYYVRPEKHHLCRNLIYPVPDPAFPFLGVHFTKMIQGGVECGPNAVLAFAREGYRRWDVQPVELWETLSHSGFQRLARQYWRMGIGELWRSWYKPAFVQALQKLVPDIQAEDLEEAPAGVRAQAVAKDGKLVDDFLIQESDRMLHVCNAPSPAATASLNIGRLLAAQLSARL